MTKELLKTAKIGVGEFAKLAGVSRVTASLWVNGHAKPHPLHGDKIDQLLAGITSAVAGGKLPLTARYKKDERLAQLKSAIAPE